MNNEIAIVFLAGLFIALTVGYPAIYSTDEWISANQIDSLATHKSLISNYERYGSEQYRIEHDNILPYPLALPILSLPAFYWFSFLGDNFRLFIVILYSLIIIFGSLLVIRMFPGRFIFGGIHGGYLGILAGICLLPFNLLYYYPFPAVDMYTGKAIIAFPEIAAIVFTNEILFACLLVVVYLIFLKSFDSKWWGIFGILITVICSSYLFWSGNAKDHELTFLLGAIAAFFLICYIRDSGYENLVCSYIITGWLIWARPELGTVTFGAIFLSTLLIDRASDTRRRIYSIISATAVFIGVLPFIINNIGITRNVFMPAMALYHRVGNGGTDIVAPILAHVTPAQGNIFLTLFGIFFIPGNHYTAGIFQVSPLSFFAVLCLVGIAWLYFSRKPLPYSSQEIGIIFFSTIWTSAILFAYPRSFFDIPNSYGVLPDIRYFALAYLPMLIIGFFSFRFINFGTDEIKTLIKTFVVYAIFLIPCFFSLFQLFCGGSNLLQIGINRYMTFGLLGISVVLFFGVIRRIIEKKIFVLSLSLLLISAALWELIVDFRFATMVFEGYHFWIPVVQQIWYIQYNIFPFYG